MKKRTNGLLDMFELLEEFFQKVEEKSEKKREICRFHAIEDLGPSEFDLLLLFINGLNFVELSEFYLEVSVAKREQIKRIVQTIREKLARETMRKEKEFANETTHDVKEFFVIAKNAKRKNVKRVIAKGIFTYKNDFKTLNFKDSKMKSFVAYTEEALTLIVDITLNKRGAEKEFDNVFGRMCEICEEIEEASE